MREIEFRGKRKDNGKWMYGSPVYLDPEHIGIWTENAQSYFWVIPETVGQYTGQIDSNGVKIYEGDILVNPHRKEDARKFLVQWDVDCSRFLAVTIPLEANAGENRYLWYVGKELNKNGLVIGNVHDNPELLEEGA